LLNYTDILEPLRHHFFLERERYQVKLWSPVNFLAIRKPFYTSLFSVFFLVIIEFENTKIYLLFILYLLHEVLYFMHEHVCLTNNAVSWGHKVVYLLLQVIRRGQEEPPFSSRVRYKPSSYSCGGKNTLAP
jgi:hypothetical protein